MKQHEAFPSRYIKADDLIAGPRTATIKDLAIEAIKSESGDEHKPVLHFQNTDKLLVLNQTNWDAIAKLHGEDSDDWLGKKITLYRTTTRFGSKTVPCVRIKDMGATPKMSPPTVQTIAEAQTQTAAAVTETEDPGADMDDEIPF